MTTKAKTVVAGLTARNSSEQMKPLTDSSPEAENKSRLRIQFDVSSGSMRRLEKLKTKIEATSNAEVVRNALKLYEALIEETEKGAVFLIREKDGTTSPFKMFLT